MKTTFIFLVVINIVPFVITIDILPSVLPRRYEPIENDPHRMKYLIYQDKDGRLQFEDLTIERPMVRELKPQDITVHLYTRRHPTTSIAFSIEEHELLHLYSFNSAALNYIIIHGWKNDYTSDVNVLIRQVILEKGDVNIFVIDWGTYSNKFYTTSKSVVPTVGLHVGEFINNLIEHFHISPAMFRLIGHSLGAHIAGCAGAAVNGKVDYIIGLDPASPLFSLKNIGNRLDETDANFVQIIHTNANFLGFSSAIGHSDYYPNGGYSQPGCGLDILGTCAHSRSYHYLAESIRHGGFTAQKCSSYDNFKGSYCDNFETSFLGTMNIDKSAHGDFYLNTNSDEPFALGTV